MEDKIILFDLDGTLIDTSKDIADAVLKVIGDEFPDQMNQSLNYKSIEKMIGRGAGPLIKSALEILSIKPEKEILEQTIIKFREYYSEHLADSSKAFKNIEKLLSNLKSQNIATAVATNKPGYLARILLPQVLEHKFEIVYGPDDVGIAKPDPKMVRDIEKITGKKAAALVGDTIVDQKTAENASIAFIGVSWGLANFDHVKPGWSSVNDALEIEEIIYKLLSENS